MRVVCSYCHKHIRDKEPLDNPALSHSMCVECHEYFLPQFKGLTTSGYLEQFKSPVLVVNQDGRVIAGNKPALAMTGRTENDPGLLGGEFMECVYARRHGGCGKTAHCQSCTIRNTVMAAFQGQDQLRVPAYLNQEFQRISMLISAHRFGEVVRVTVEELLGVEPRLPDPEVSPEEEPSNGDH